MLTRRLLFSAPVQQCLLHRFGKNLQNLSTTKRLNVSIRRGYVSAPGSGDGSSSDGPRDSGSGSRIRMNFSEECEHAINKQINLELYASYVYFQMACHFERDDIALAGFEKYFTKQSEDERSHAKLLMTLLNKRGGRVILDDIPSPTKQCWSSTLEMLEAALDLEKQVNEKLLLLHSLAHSHSDAHLSDYLEANFLDEQVKSIYHLSRLITNLKRTNMIKGLGEFLFDVHAFDRN